MKYFIVSYSFPDGNGSVNVEDPIYPNYEELLERVKATNVHVDSISIISIMKLTAAEYYRFYSKKG